MFLSRELLVDLKAPETEIMFNMHTMKHSSAHEEEPWPI